MDVGFGSAQISLFDKDSLVATQNLPLGSLRLRSQLAKIVEPASVVLFENDLPDTYNE